MYLSSYVRISLNLLGTHGSFYERTDVRIHIRTGKSLCKNLHKNLYISSYEIFLCGYI